MTSRACPPPGATAPASKSPSPKSSSCEPGALAFRTAAFEAPVEGAFRYLSGPVCVAGGTADTQERSSFGTL